LVAPALTMWFATRTGVENSRKTCSPEIIIIIITITIKKYQCYYITRVAP